MRWGGGRGRGREGLWGGCGRVGEDGGGGWGGWWGRLVGEDGRGGWDGNHGNRMVETVVNNNLRKWRDEGEGGRKDKERMR